MAGGTGVGGIKDSQGNYSIIAKGDSQLGTRSGTLSVPLGDVVGQTPGSLSINALVRSDTFNDEAISIGVSSFVPGTPPSAPVQQVGLTLGTEQVGINEYPVFALRSNNSEGISLDTQDYDSDPEVRTLTANANRVYLDANSVIPNKITQTSTVSVESMFFFRIPTLADSRVITAPFDGYFTDVVACGASADPLRIRLDGNPICIVPPGVGGDNIRRATNISTLDFTKGQQIEAFLPAGGASSLLLVKVYFVRTGNPF